MYKYIITLLFIISSMLLNGQVNLVPNFSFEDKDSCPTYSNFTHFVKDWFTPFMAMQNPPPDTNGIYWTGGGARYFHHCGSPTFSVPNNMHQNNRYANSGIAYCSLVIINTIHDQFYNSTIYFHGYIELKLKEKLLKNAEYCGEFYYGLVPYGDSSYFSEKVKTLELEMLFTDTIVYKHEGMNTYWPQNIYANAQISHKMKNKDTVNWIKVSGSFIAKGGEEYLTIGNFIPYDTARGEVFTLVFIDDVSVYHCGPDTSTQTTKELEIPNIFTPNGDGYNDVFEYKNQEDWHIETQIFNRWGELLFSEKNINWDGKYKGKKVSEGVYFYKINAKALRGGEIKVFNGAVHVLYN